MANGPHTQGDGGGGLPDLPGGKLAFTSDVTVVQNWLKAREKGPLTKAGGKLFVPQLCVVVKVTSNAPGGEKYFGKLLEPNEGDISPNGTLSEEELGVLPTFENVLFLNVTRYGQNSHSLTSDGGMPYALGVVRHENSSDGYIVVDGISIGDDHCISVFVTKDGGSDGSKTTAATWTYTAKNAAGVVLGTGLTPARARPRGTLTPASNGSRGLATYDTTGNLILLDAYGEFPGTGGCVPS